MTRLLHRYRRVLTLSSALILSFVLMTLQVRRESSLIDLTKRVVLTSVSPVLRIAAGTKTAAVSLWNEYIDLRRVRRDNQLLREQTRHLRAEVSELREAALENHRLAQLLSLRGRLGAEAVAVRVIAKDSTNWFGSILIDRGTHAGIQRHMVVVAPEGLVGRVVDVTPLAARVQLITDPESAVGCLMLRTRVTGVAAGTQRGAVQIKYLPQMADVAVGDQVVTSGMGGVFPKGIPLGKVIRSSRPAGALFLDTEVQPLVDFSRLEEAIVLRERPPHDSVWGDTGRMP
jgi:rod shape-determining protein MreC